MLFESAHLKTYQRVRRETREVYSPLIEHLRREEMIRIGELLGLVKKRVFVFDETGVDTAAIHDYALFEVILTDPIRLERILRSLPEAHRPYLTETKDSAYSVYRILSVDRRERRIVVEDCLRNAERHEITDLNLSQTLAPRNDLLLSWRLIRLEGIEMTTGVLAPLAPSDLTSLRAALEKRMRQGSTFKAAMAHLWPANFRRRHGHGLLCTIEDASALATPSPRG